MVSPNPAVAVVEDMPAPVGAERIMQARRAKEYPALAAQNADEPGVDTTGLPTPKSGPVRIEASAAGDVHLGDERVIYGDGDGHLEDGARRPKTAMVDKEVADALVKAKKAKRA